MSLRRRMRMDVGKGLVSERESQQADILEFSINWFPLILVSLDHTDKLSRPQDKNEFKVHSHSGQDLQVLQIFFFSYSYFLAKNNCRACKCMVNVCKMMQITNKPYGNFLTGLSESRTISNSKQRLYIKVLICHSKGRATHHFKLFSGVTVLNLVMKIIVKKEKRWIIKRSNQEKVFCFHSIQWESPPLSQSLHSC